MFRPYKFILRPSKNTDPRDVYVSLHCKTENRFSSQNYKNTKSQTKKNKTIRN